jgi:hypothetical protein
MIRSEEVRRDGDRTRAGVFMRVFTIGAVLLALAGSASGQTLKTDEVLSSISVQALSPPSPVRGADGRVHLAYELFMANPGIGFVRIDKLEAVDAKGESLATLQGDALTKMMHIWSGSARTLSPGGTAYVFMDVSVPESAKVPGQIATRIAAFRQSSDSDGKPTALPADSPVGSNYIFTTAPVSVGRPAIVLASPLRGPRWVAFNGCCASITSHRGAIMPVNGRPLAAERFAIDWVQLTPDGHLYKGDPEKLESYPGYGAPIYAAGSGVVVNLYDEADEQVPSHPAAGIVPANIGGNMVVIDMGAGQYAFYAHLQRGKLKVKLGDRVKAGQEIGFLGNTGNSDGPHLHFHVMDGPSPLDANGLPYVFTRFSSAGVVANGEAVEHGAAAEIDARLKGEDANALPLDNQIVDFP